MKKSVLLIVVLFCISIQLFCQAPIGFNYQAVLRGADQKPLVKNNVNLRFSILSRNQVQVFSETQLATTNEIGLINLVIGEGEGSDDLSLIDWAEGGYSLKIEIDADGGSNFNLYGTAPLLPVPYSLASSSLSNNVTRISIQGSDEMLPGDPLFIVRRTDGYPVFAVYEDGVYAYTDTVDTEKGVKGGFAVGGYRKTSKGTGQEYMHVTADSIRFYIEDDPLGKGIKGGFAVGGYRKTSKGSRDYFNISAQTTAEKIFNENRIVWYPHRNAFLAGKVLVESPDSVGTNSMSTGYESKSIGDWSQALGYQAIARGDYSTSIGKNPVAYSNSSFAFGNEAKAIGINSFSFGQWAIAENEDSYAFGKGAIAEGYRSFAFGSSGIDSAEATTGVTYAIGDYSFAIGQGSVSSGLGSFTMGLADTASGRYSTAIGYLTAASGDYSTAMGFASSASGRMSTTMGWNTKASGHYATAMGYRTTASGLFSIAMGVGSEASQGSSIAMGENTMASGWRCTAMGYETTASGEYSTAMGCQTTASGEYSTALGCQTTASGEKSTAMGYFSQADEYFSTAMGHNTRASGFYSTTMGFQTTASNTACIAMGFNTKASGRYSTALGYQTIARSAYSFVTGRYNDTLSTSSLLTWVDTDPLFIIGNGNADDARHNAMMVRKNGEILFPNVYSDIIGITYRDLYIDNTGNIGYVSSSLRYKKNIKLIDNLSWLYQLSPVNFIYKNDESETEQYGLIAEEVEKVNPRFVSYNEKGEPETVSYSQLVTPMLKALQEQQKQIEELKKEIELLKASSK